MAFLRGVTEGLARKTTRRGFFGRGTDLAFGALIGAAAGAAAWPDGVRAGGAGTVCAFPGPPCDCEHCQTNGVCAKPCVIVTQWYSSGCWTSPSGPTTVTCCDCECPRSTGGSGWCGCGSDYHNDPAYCPS